MGNRAGVEEAGPLNAIGSIGEVSPDS
jgi:hypothetical protein